MKTFNLDGQSFSEGIKLTITTPEFGTLTVSTEVQSFSHGDVVGLKLHPAAGAPTCSCNWSLYSNGNGYTTLQLAYLCHCGMNVHPRSYQWFDVKIEGDKVSTGLAREEKPLPALNIPPRADLVTEPNNQHKFPLLSKEDMIAYKNGQLTLFP